MFKTRNIEMNYVPIKRNWFYDMTKVIDVMTKVDHVLTNIYNLETSNSEHFSIRETTSTHPRSLFKYHWNY